MTYPRKSLISLQDTPYYHCVARCVRRAWLWGFDSYAGRDYSHRKAWVLQRLAHLSSTFAIDVCAYAVMANHYHLVLHVDRGRACEWTQEEVIQRWSRLFRVPQAVRQWQQEAVHGADSEAVEALIEQWRGRLHDISWFMRAMNEYLARRANAEDECKGRFWEGRFKSQALLDEAGLLTAMVYVDLNPIRAGIAATPESSPFTSIYQRIDELQGQTRLDHCAQPTMDPQVPLLKFHSGPGGSDRAAIPHGLDDYLKLVDWTGRQICAGKPGSIDTGLPPIMQRLSIDAGVWLGVMRPAGNAFGRAMGKLDRLRLHAQTLGQAWVKGLHKARQLYAG